MATHLTDLDFMLSPSIFTSYLISQKDQSSLLSHSRPPYPKGHEIHEAVKKYLLKKIPATDRCNYRA